MLIRGSFITGFRVDVVSTFLLGALWILPVPCFGSESNQSILWTDLSPNESWEVQASEVERVKTPEGAIWRWKLKAGQPATLALRPSSDIFEKLPRYGRLELDFRVASGRIESLGFLAAGHVSGPRKYKVHQWSLGIQTTPRGPWISRQLDLARPSWFPWDNPDGMKSEFAFEAMATEPGTVVEFRDLRLLASDLVIKPFFEVPITWPEKQVEADGSVTYRMNIPVQNVSSKPATIRAEVASTHKEFQISVEPAEQPAKNGEAVEFAVTARIAKDAITRLPELAMEDLKLRFFEPGDPTSAQTFQMPLVRPLSAPVNHQFAYTPETLAALRKRIAKGDESIRKAVAYDELIKEADAFCAIRLDQIPRGYNHPSNDWPTVPGSTPPVRYEIGSVMPEIVNPVTKQAEVGTPMADMVWKEYLGYSGKITEKLGLAYALTGDEKYAAKAVELMTAYANQYGQLPWSPRNDVGWAAGPTILAASRIAAGSTYGTNRFFLWHMKMLALIAGAPSLTPEVKQRIVEGFVRPYATELLKFPGGISNMTDMTNHNLLILGLVFDDAHLVRWALRSDPGLTSRLNDLDKDGFSSEGRPLNYHYASLDEYLPSLAYLKNSGLAAEIPKDRLLEAVRMPYRRATLWGVVPNAGDCGRGFRVGLSKLADQLFELFPEEPWLLDIGVGSTVPAKVLALDAKRAPNPEAYKAYLETAPRLFRGAGLAILRSGTTAETQIMTTLDYGASPMHAHRDRNQITLSAFGKVFSHGPGTLYNVGSGGMVRGQDPRLDAFCASGSLGQNVIMVDGQNQDAAIGELLEWSEAPERQFAIARVEGAYPGVIHTRALILQDGLVVVVDRIEADSEKTLDWVYHNFGTLAPGTGWQFAPAAEPLGTAANYQNIVDLQRVSGSGTLRLNWDLSDQTSPAGSPDPAKIGLALWQLAPEGTNYFTGKTGMNNPNTTEVPDAVESLFSRVRAKSADFVTVLEPFHDTPKITGIQKTGNQLQVQRDAKTSTLALPNMEK